MGRRARPTPKPTARARVQPDFTRLPERIAPEDMVTTQAVEPPEDPQGGRDTETEFMLRNAGF
jgi:hypothetical protein